MFSELVVWEVETFRLACTFPVKATQSAALNLDALVLAFSSQVSRAAQREVAQLGIREVEHATSLWQRYILPVTPDLPRLSGALDRAIELRFTREDVEVPASVSFAQTLDELYDFNGRNSLDAARIAGVNEVLGVDALFVARLARTASATTT